MHSLRLPSRRGGINVARTIAELGGRATAIFPSGASLREAIAFGVVAGGAAVMNPGTELCRRSDVERLWNQVEKLAG